MKIVSDLKKVRPKLRGCLESHFNLSELKTLAFDLNVQYETLEHKTLEDFSRELILYFERISSLGCLIENVIKRCPNEELINALASLPACSPDTKLQIIAITRGMQGEMPEDLVEGLAKWLGTTPDKIKLIAAVQGTVHLLVSVSEIALAQATSSLDEALVDKSIKSIIPFNSLNRIAQITWRVLAVYLDIPPPSLMQMNFYWDDAVRIIREGELAYEAQQKELPEEAKYYYGAGSMLLYMQRWAEAIAKFTTALELASRFAAAKLKRGLAYEALGRKATALEDYDAAIKLDPYSVQAYNCRGAIHVSNGNFTKALEDFGKAIGVDPQYQVSYLNHGATLYRLRRYKEAIADFSNAIQLDRNSKQAYLGRGLTLAKSGYYEGALKDFDRAQELDPNDPRISVNRGMIFEHMQRYEEALADYQSALKLEPDNERFQTLATRALALTELITSDYYEVFGSGKEQATWGAKAVSVESAGTNSFDEREELQSEEEEA